MKIKEGFILRKVAESNVIVPVGEETMNFNGMITTNETGAFIFEQLQQGIEIEEIAEKMIEEFEIDKETAIKDIENFVQKLDKANLFE